MKNTPTTVECANALGGTSWTVDSDTREIISIKNAEVSPYDNHTILADVFWRKAGGKVRKHATPLTTFRTWLNKASFNGKIELE